MYDVSICIRYMYMMYVFFCKEDLEMQKYGAGNGLLFYFEKNTFIK